MPQPTTPPAAVSPTGVSHQLYRLVKALNKAEKRAFRLYAQRSGGAVEPLFVRLFDVVDGLRAPDDERARARLGLTPQRYTNAKRHLYRELLVATRLLAARHDVDCGLREQLDFAHLLYGKGLALDALRVLARAKARATEHHRDLLHLEIVEFEKLIEARHVTHSRSAGDHMDRLVNESARRSYEVLAASEMANINLQIHGYYIDRGHARTPAEHAGAERFWREIQASPIDLQVRGSTFHQRFHRFQAEMWYRYVRLDLARAEDRARGAATLFQFTPQMTARDPALYTRALYYVSAMTYLRGDGAAAGRYAGRLRRFREERHAGLNRNARIFAGLYAYLAGFNDAFLRADFDAAHALSEALRAELHDGRLRPSPQRIALLRYRLAATAYARADYATAIGDLHEVLNARGVGLRDDLHINARLLHALCHEALGHGALLAYDLDNIARFLRGSPEAAEVHRAVVQALRRRLRAGDDARRAALVELQTRVRELRGDAFEAKALRYLDVGVWLGRELG